MRYNQLRLNLFESKYFHYYFDFFKMWKYTFKVDSFNCLILEIFKLVFGKAMLSGVYHFSLRIATTSAISCFVYRIYANYSYITYMKIFTTLDTICSICKKHLWQIDFLKLDIFSHISFTYHAKYLHSTVDGKSFRKLIYNVCKGSFCTGDYQNLDAITVNK